MKVKLLVLKFVSADIQVKCILKC